MSTATTPCPKCSGIGWRFVPVQKRDGERFRCERVECPCGAAERERERRAKADLPRLRAFWEAKEQKQ